ncbi:MAG: mucoidy inhibitor MuiA family protein [Thermodesulfobacteriota bacterium]|nr:mucoidy inhibitor MuiA family protein [Thermodesulfobacteriota bacterium]
MLFKTNPLGCTGLKIILGCLVVLALPVCHVSAAVTEAVIYPEGGTLTEGAVLSAGENTFSLPAQARPETLTVSLGDERFHITGLTREKAATAPSEAIARLEASLEDKTLEKAAIQDRIKTVSGQIGFWENQISRQWETAADAMKIADALETPLREGYRTKTELHRELSAVEKAIEAIREKIENLTGSRNRQWKIDLTLKGPENIKCPATYTYFFPECGFKPFYRLNAHMEKGEITFSWNADIWQRTGRDWKNATIVLTTARPAFDLAPPDLSPWILREQKPVFTRKKTMADTARYAGSPRREQALAEAPAAKTVQKSRKQTTTEWLLGKRSISAGDPRRIHIEDTALPAEFVHLLRPSETEKSFVRAAINLDEPLQAPRGDAIFMIEGTMVGQSSFSVQAQDADLFFGTDPLVTAERTLVEKKKGKEGFIRNEQTHDLKWETNLENAHAYSVETRVETPAPRGRDKAIEITRELTPPASKAASTPDVLVWELTVPGGETLTIREAVTITAPSSMDLDLGV